VSLLSDFGSGYAPPLAGVPIRLVNGGLSGSGPLVLTTTAVPNGQTFVVLGIDFFGESGAAAQLVAAYTINGGVTVWGGSVDLTTPLFEGGLTWRGALALSPGEYIECQCDVSPSPVAMGLAAWGVVLPYVNA